MTIPLIALTTYPADGDGRVNLPSAYIEAVRRAGGRPILIAPGEPDPEQILEQVEGLVLTGGGDIDPSRWGGPEHQAIYATSNQRDELELTLARAAVERAFPLLAICRGHQVLNVALGGTLVVHIPDHVANEVSHRLPPRQALPHAVQVDPTSQLAATLGCTECEPMSWHHQSVDELGCGLRAVAWADDGIVEASEHDDHPFLVSVQWHPELTADVDPPQQRLFDALVAASR